MKKFFVAMTALSSALSAGCGASVGESDDGEEILGEDTAALSSGGNIHAKGAFTCDIRLEGGVFGPGEIAPALERDRMIMSRQDGMLNKHLPIALDFEHFSNGQPDLLTGGRYLFDKAKDAADYEEFVKEDFVLDGVQFLDRSFFLESECHSYKVVGAHDFTDIHTTHVVVRTERFHMTGAHSKKKLKNVWPAVKAEAASRGMASVWLVYNDQEDIASVIYMNDRIVPYDPNAPDFATLGYLAGAPPLGHHIEDLGFPRTFDRTHWVLTIWMPFVDGDHGEPSIWPHSPPFDLPFCGDGVCEVSRGEGHASCAADCPVKCGNAVCQPFKGENDLNCPGDCGGSGCDD